MFTNLTEETKTFHKGLMIAQFTIMNSQDYADIHPVHPIAATYLLQATPHVNVTKQEFQQITQLAKEVPQNQQNPIEKLAKEVQELTDKYNHNTPPSDIQHHDIIDYRPLEGATNEIWFATP